MNKNSYAGQLGVKKLLKNLYTGCKEFFDEEEIRRPEKSRVASVNFTGMKLFQL